jgi:hypothetical protein
VQFAISLNLNRSLPKKPDVTELRAVSDRIEALSLGRARNTEP